MADYLGELAALTTAVLWSFTAVFFTLAGERVGSVVVNRLRLIIAAVLLVLTHWLVIGTPFPQPDDPARWLWLGLSGVVGLVLGDSFLFQSYLWIGPRLGMLMMSLAPIIAAFLAAIFLGESLNLHQWLGVILAVSGTASVVMDRPPTDPGRVRDHRRGLLFGLGAATGQAVGLVLAKQGLYGDFPALSGNVMRMLSAALAIWIVTLGLRQGRRTFLAVSLQPKALPTIFAGAATGPFLGVWLSLVAIQLTRVGVASTLMALSPIFLLPVGAFLFKDRVGWRAVLGTLIAIFGVALLFIGS